MEDVPEDTPKEQKKDQVRSFAPEHCLHGDKLFPLQSARARLTEFLPFVDDFVKEMLGRHSDAGTSNVC